MRQQTVRLKIRQPAPAAGRGATCPEKVLLLYGSGANGKSVFFEIIMAMLGPENVCNYSLEQLTNDDKYQRAMIGAAVLRLVPKGEPVAVHRHDGKAALVHL